MRSGFRLRKPGAMLAAAGSLALVSGLLTGVPAAPAAADGVPHIVYAWGTNRYGQLGDGSFTSRRGAPVPVDDHAGNVTQISAGQTTSAAVHSDGTLWTWGYYFLLGDGSSTTRERPALVPSLPPIRQ